MRKAAISAAAIFSALALALYLWRISPFLPERGGTTCFAADYSPPRPVDLGLAKARLEERRRYQFAAGPDPISRPARSLTATARAAATTGAIPCGSRHGLPIADCCPPRPSAKPAIASSSASFPRYFATSTATAAA